MPISITLVRHGRAEGRTALERYIFGGRYGGLRVPRGLDPELVSEFLREHIKPDTSPGSYAAAGAVIRFYELPDVLPHIRLALSGHESTSDDVQRSAFAIESIGDLGPPSETAQAADYLDRVLVPQATAVDNFAVLFQALIALAPAGSPARLVQRLAGVVEHAAQLPQNEQGIRAYQKLAAIQRNDQPKYWARLEAKKRLLAQPPDQRRGELVLIYLRQSPFSDTQMEEWTGRMLRAEAMMGNPEPVYAYFGRAIDMADPEKTGPKQTDFIVVRAAQAILYLQGKLTPPQLERYKRAPKVGMNFLWDDLPLDPD